MKSCAGIVAVSVWIALVFCGGARADEKPSWFPRTACKSIFRTDSELRFQPGKSYAQYEKSLVELAHQKHFQEFTNRSDCYKSWTVLIAMDADNDLMPYSLWDLYEIEAAYSDLRGGSTLKKDVIVQWDPAGNKGVKRLHMFQTNVPYRQYTLADFQKKDERNVLSPIIEKLPEQKGNKKERFQDFIEWGMKRYPAEHYVVILWGHGKGWILDDKASEVHLTLPELKASLQHVFLNTLEGKKKIDNFVADSCYMQGIEVTTEIAPFARFVTGSEQTQNFLGIPYRTLFWEMNHNFDRLKKKRKLSQDEDEPENLARLLPELTHATYEIRAGLQGRIDKKGIASFTYSSVDTEQLEQALLPPLNEMARVVGIFVKNSDEQIYQDRIYALRNLLSPLTVFGSGALSMDLGAFLEVLKVFILQSEPQPSQQAKNALTSIDTARRALDQAIIAHERGTRYEPETGFMGLSVWIPASKADFMATVDVFSESEFFKKFNSQPSNTWTQFLQIISATE